MTPSEYPLPSGHSRMADEGKIMEVLPRTGGLYVIPSWGYLEEIELRFQPPLANMNTSHPLRLIIESVGCEASFQVYARVRNVL